MLRRSFALAAMALLFAGIFTPVSGKETITFGVVPQQSAKKLAANWGPIFAYLSKKSGLAISFATAPDIPEFEYRLADGRYEVAYMNPYHYTVFCRSPGYLALARQKDKRIVGIIVAHKESPYTDLRELAGKEVAFPSPAAFAASILTRAHLKQSGISVVPKYVKSHDSVYLNVVNGFCEAGGGVVRTLMNSPLKVRDELKIIWKSKPFTPHAIAVHPRVPEAVRHHLLSAFLSMNDDETAKPLLKAIHFKGFSEADDKDWDDVRALGIDLLAPSADP